MKKICIFLLVLSSNLIAQENKSGYLSGASSLEDLNSQTISSDIQKYPNQNVSSTATQKKPVGQFLNQSKIVTYFRYGTGVSSEKEGSNTYNSLGIKSINEEYYYGISYDINNNEGFKSKTFSYHLGTYMFEGKLPVKPYFGVNAGYFTAKDTGLKLKGIALGADLGVVMYNSNTVEFVGGFKYDNTLNDSNNLKNYSLRNLYIGIGVSF